MSINADLLLFDVIDYWFCFDIDDLLSSLKLKLLTSTLILCPVIFSEKNILSNVLF